MESSMGVLLHLRRGTILILFIEKKPIFGMSGQC
jgi:hypothetical protein